MTRLRVAVASNDGTKFVGRHFGDANFYYIYDVSTEGSEFVHRVANETEEEERHADPRKARGIAGILKKQGVQVAVTKVFGPNIKRIKSKFVCVITAHDDVADGLAQIQKNFQDVANEWDKGEERNFLDLRS